MKLFETIAKNYLNEADEILVQIGDFVLTRNDIETKYKDKIINHFGEYNEDTLNNALWTLWDIGNLYDKGGYIYRALWLGDKSDFDYDNPGDHWVVDKGDLENIVELFTMRDNKTDKAFYVKAYTPPNNVTIPYDYFNNLEEREVLVIDDKLLTDVQLFEY